MRTSKISENEIFVMEAATILVASLTAGFSLDCEPQMGNRTTSGLEFELWISGGTHVRDSPNQNPLMTKEHWDRSRPRTQGHKNQTGNNLQGKAPATTANRHQHLGESVSG
jgi:hypothetical protein